jgi:hypothetical protein
VLPLVHTRWHYHQHIEDQFAILRPRHVGPRDPNATLEPVLNVLRLDPGVALDEDGIGDTWNDHRVVLGRSSKESASTPRFNEFMTLCKAVGIR